MSLGLTKMAEDAEKLLDQGRILPALELLKQARSMTGIASRKLLFTYNIGAIYWDKLGDGMSARIEYTAAAGIEAEPAAASISRILRANALENLMLSAVSYEEFDNFTARLRALAPEMPVVSGLPPDLHKMRDEGRPWSDAMYHLAISNYDRNNPATDRGRYGVGKSTFHIMLATRKQQRLSREDWRTTVNEYTILAIRMASDCLHLRGGDNDRNPPEEYLPILTDALPFIDEYLEASPGDDDMHKRRSDMQTMISNMRGRWAAISRGASTGSGNAESGSTSGYRCRRCHKPLPDPTESCPACGTAAPIMMLGPMIFLGSAGAAALTWKLLGARAMWERGLIAAGAAIFVFVVIGPLLFQISLAMLKDRND